MKTGRSTLLAKSIITNTLIVLLIMVGGILVFRFILVRSLFNAQGSSTELEATAISNDVAYCLMNWGIFGPVPDRDPEYTNLRNSIAHRIYGIRGFTQSDGFHGDGSDWYEVELSADMVNQLRTVLTNSSTVEIMTTSDFGLQISVFSKMMPSWWPREWSNDVNIYSRYSEYLILPNSGTRAWFLRIRI